MIAADVPVGSNLMQGAMDNGIDSILGECGGACACATCHVYVEEPWLEKIDEASNEEAGMLEVVVDPQSNSRLGCQVTVTEDLDGLTVRLPESQL
jgi:2Fe-2S ferredoxin